MKRRTKKVMLYSVLGLVGLVLIAVVSALIAVRTDWFKNKVRDRIVAIAETATGGRVEIGRFDYQWPGLTVEVAPFIIHGKEPPGSPPFFRAEKIQIGLKIVSALKKEVDIRSVIAEKPRMHVTVAADGTTNVPEPKIRRQSKENIAEQLLDLKVNHFELHDGFAEYNSKRIPLDVQGDHLRASFGYEAAGPRYVGEFSSHQLHAISPEVKAPLAFDLDVKAALEKNVVHLVQASLSNGETKVELKGSVQDLSSPHTSLEIAANAPVKELNKMFGLPLESRGNVVFAGTGSVQTAPFEYRLAGKLNGRDLAYASKDLAIRNIAFSSPVEVTPSGIMLHDLEVAALHGQFRGSAQFADFKRLSLKGTAKNFSLKELATLGARNSGELSGALSGTVALEAIAAKGGLSGVDVQAKLDIVPGKGGVPVQGQVTVNYDQRAGRIALGNSQVNLGSTHLNVTGTLGQALSVHIESQNLNEFLPLFPLMGEAPPEQIPISLKNGLARFDGSVTGPLANPHIAGKIDLTNFLLDQRQIDHLTSTFDIDKSAADLHTLTLDQAKLHVEGQGRIGLSNWKLEDSSSVSALLSVRDSDLQKLLADNGSQAPVTGSLTATVRVSGTFESPLVNANVDLQNVTAYDEHFERAHADVTLTATAMEITNADLRSGRAQITGSGAYNHPASDWNDGAVRFDVVSNRLNLPDIHHVQEVRKGLGGELDLKANGTAKVVKGAISLSSLNGQLSLKNAVVDGQPYGNLQLTATTRLPVLAVSAKVDLRGIQIQGSGEWRMEGDYPGEAHIQIPKITFATLHDLWPGQRIRTDLPFDGFLQGDAAISGPLNKWESMKAVVTLSAVQMNANPNARPMAGAKVQDLILSKVGPVQFEGTTKNIQVKSASFKAKDTTLDITGQLALDSKNPWDLSVKGQINLSILQLFNADLLAAGTSVVNVAVRGSFTEPQVDGRLELKNASLFLRDLPNGVDQANGLIVFDRNRATVQNLSAVTGGGKVSFETGSFVGFRGPALVYRLQATADQVRYRSPDGVSVTVNGRLSLIGTSNSSVLAGTVVVVRANFNPRTDVGSLLATTAKPVSVPSEPNEYLRGIQFDVNVVSSRALEVQTSLTRNIQADANLRIRGTPERPVVLGNLTVNSGQIEFFGNKYSISRGEVNFYSPSKIEPIIDMDLETQVRGVVVDISFSGPLSKLNFSYRSDPPLETNDIIALLAVGRAPQTVGGLASSQTSTTTNYLATGSNALLGQAIAPATGRLQRFFGVSHIKIDPQLTDITSVPQARLTLEQQVSNDITLT
ncbi:MAG TPA: translocation/assembly module TamB domain-containing protein, partial [Bryobacteraceae bacterium]